MSNLEQKLREALACHERGDIQRASALYRSILETNAENPKALHFLGLAEFQSGNVETGCKLVDLSILYAPRESAFLLNRSGILLQIGRTGDALSDATKALHIDPTSAEAYFRKGNAQQALGKLDEAIASYSSCISLNPAHLTALSNRGAIFLKSKKPVQALDEDRKSVV